MKLSKIEFSYPIVIGSGAINELAKMLKGKYSRKVFLLSDERLVAARKITLKTLKKAKCDICEIPLKAGEGLKDIKSVYAIYGELLKNKADRDSIIIALGGGTIGDVAGFIASTYLRGIDWVGLPTTLLAQVDSSVGGKTGINHAAGKNLIGTFYPPAAVICDLDFLKTLSSREMISGAGEMVKYGFIFDPAFFKFVQKNIDAILARKTGALQKAIFQSLEWKCGAVLIDEFDRTGVREVLNFGHTFGHALETATGYKKFQHGEAVIWGMRFALALSQQRKKITREEREQMDSFLQKLKVPAIPKGITAKKIFELMKHDKKSEGKKIRFVLLDRMGKAVSDRNVTASDLQAAYSMIMEDSHGQE